MRLDHINIRAPMELLQEVKAFYCNLLELREGARPDFGGRGYWLYAEGQAVLHLSEGGGRHSNLSRGYLDHVAFRATGLEAMVGRLESAGVEYHSSYIPELDLSQVFFADPAGNGLEVNFSGERL